MFRSESTPTSPFQLRTDLDGQATKLLAGLFLVLAPLMAVFSLADTHEPESVVQLERVVITASRIDTAQAPLVAPLVTPSTPRGDRS